MDLHSRRELMDATWKRYRQASKAGKTRILDEYCNMPKGIYIKCPSGAATSMAPLTTAPTPRRICRRINIHTCTDRV